MRARNESLLTDILPAEERAIDAVIARYQRVAPAVTRFARSVSGNENLRVRLGSRSSSRQDEVVLDPGLFQAAYLRRAPVTPSEVALASALHEVIHLAVTDFEEPRVIPAEWLADDQEQPLEPVPLLKAINYAGGPAADALFLSLEDARQETVHLDTYKGARSVLGDMYRAAVPDAMSSIRPLGQYALACFLMVGDYLDREYLEKVVEPHVAMALDDATTFIADVRHSRDPWDVGFLALQLLAVARLHGLVTDASESAAVGDAEQQESDKDAISDGVDSVRLASPILADINSYEDTKEASQSAAGESDKAGDSDLAGDPTTDHLIRVSEAPTVYPPVGTGGKLVVTPFPNGFSGFAANGRESLEEAARNWDVAQRRVSGELWPLFIANQRRGLRSGYDAGDLSPYAALLLGGGLYQRMFERRALSSRRSYAVSLLIDGSASMLQPRELPGGSRAPWGMAAATLGAWSLARLADELQVEFEVGLFNRAFAAGPDDTETSYQKRMHAAAAGLKRTQQGSADRLTRTVNHYLLKSFADRWRASEDLLAGLFWTAAEPRKAAAEAGLRGDTSPPVSMFDKAANVDEYNVSHAVERLNARRAEVRILVVLADGMTRGSIESLSATVEDAERGGTNVLGIGIGDGTVQTAYSQHEVVERPDALTKAMVEGVRTALRGSLSLSGGEEWWHRSKWTASNQWSNHG
ncbi:MAG: hypothetical protein HKO76_01220 [Acidimicrobiia bacterium]|nr:hypothetical protein [Acidimicrobiia bacterium]